MTPAGRLGAIAEIVEDWVRGRGALDMLMRDWAKHARFAGSSDRRAIREAVFDIARHRRAYGWRMGAESGRALALAHMRWGLRYGAEQVAHAASGWHGPGAVCADEMQLLKRDDVLPEAVASGLPEWCEPHFERTFGNAWAREAKALLKRADLDLRVNTARSDRERVQAALAKENLDTEPGHYSPWALKARRVKPGFDIRRTPVWAQGLVEVQDEGSQLASLASAAAPKERVVDLCAGGGGKTLALAAMMGGTGQLLACDINRDRLDEVRRRANRAKATNVETRLLQDWAPDAGSDPEAGSDPDLGDLEDKADLVLIDAPCTGSGTWRRKPDAKWRLREARLDHLTQVQSAVLARAARIVRPGGRIVYVTCSLFVQENNERVAHFLIDHPDFAAAPPVGVDGVPIERIAAEFGVLLTPARLGTDGFYISVLTRTA